MTAIPRPRTSWELLCLAFVLALLGTAGAARPAAAAGPVEQLAASVPPPAGQATLRDGVTGLRTAADRRDQRDRHDPALLAVLSAAAGAALLLAGRSRVPAGGRGRRGRLGPAAPRGPPLPEPA
jgi:hypothetical protein